MSHRRKRKNKKQVRVIVTVSVITLLFITTGYAAISTNITLNAKGNIIKNNTGISPSELTKNLVTEGDGLYKDEIEENEEERYTYKGKNPDNYINFNCDENGENCETWRIIGVFGDNIKIIKDESIGDKAWNENLNNDWSNSTLKEYLNGDYYDSLSEEAQGQIEEMIWYIGGNSTSKVTTAEAYTFEHGSVPGKDSSEVTWTGKIALMYPSDYGYASSSCYTGIKTLYYYDDSSCNGSNWLFNNSYEWLLSPDSYLVNHVFTVDDTGSVDSDGLGNYRGSYVHNVRPTLYLKSSIKLSGSGTEQDPYTIS